MMGAFNLHMVAQVSAERLLNSLVEGLAIALFAWILLRLTGRRNSGTRFAVWFCALLAIAVSPFVQLGGVEHGVVPASAAAFTIPRAWALYLFGAWAVIAPVGLMRVAGGFWHLRKIRRDCTVLDVRELDPALQETLADLRSARAVEICVSQELRVPTAIGFAKPAVVLPAWALRDLSVTELRTVLLHELAHLRRWDDWTNLAQKILRALFFFHPAVWWVENRLALEREMACDDIVLAHTANPRAYAECLVSLAEKNLLRRGVALAQAAVGRMRQTSLRILRILDARAPHVVQVWKPAPWVVGAFSIACLVSSAHAPRLVAFGDSHVAVQAGASPVAMSPDSALRGAHVVRASYVDRTTAPKVGAPKARRPVRAAVSRPSNPVREAESQPVVVRARASVPNGVAPGGVRPQQAMFVVMQGQQYGEAGPVLWLSVWRVTVDPQGNRQVVQEFFARAI